MSKNFAIFVSKVNQENLYFVIVIGLLLFWQNALRNASRDAESNLLAQLLQPIFENANIMQVKKDYGLYTLLKLYRFICTEIELTSN